MTKRHNFHCQFCGMECTIYKHGKKHRVIVCPVCGVLATNPSALGFLRGSQKLNPAYYMGKIPAVRKGKEVLSKYAGLSDLNTSMENLVYGSEFNSQGQAGSTPYSASPKQTIIHKSERDYLFTPEEKVNLALK